MTLSGNRHFWFDEAEALDIEAVALRELLQSDPFFFEDEPVDRETLALRNLLSDNPFFLDEHEPLFLKHVSTARKIFRYRSPKALRVRIEGLFECNYDDDVRGGALGFFVHLYVSTLIARDGWHEDGRTWIPLPSKFISDNFGRVNRKKKVGKKIIIALEKTGHVLASKASADAGRCRNFSISPELMLSLVRLTVEHVEDDDWVNLVTGKTIDLKAREEGLFADPKAASSKPTGRPSSLKTRLVLNFASAKGEVLMMLRQIDALGSASVDTKTLGGASLRRSLYATARSLVAIRSAPSFRWKRGHPGFASYLPVYQNKTRRYEVMGRFQTCPARIKQALIEGTGAKNSDIEQCHPRCALVLAGALNSHREFLREQDKSSFEHLIAIQTKGKPGKRFRKKDGTISKRCASTTSPGFAEFVDTEGARALIAKQSGLPEKLIKKTINVTLYGGNISSSSWTELGRSIRELAPNEKPKEVATKLKGALPWLLPFRTALFNTVDIIVERPHLLARATERLRKMFSVTNSGGDTFVCNARGNYLVVEYDDNGVRVTSTATIVSHLLVGIEQDAVQSLVKACEEEGIGVFANEHDGIVTSVSIPQYVVKKAQGRCLLGRRLIIREKPFWMPNEDGTLERLLADLS